MSHPLTVIDLLFNRHLLGNIQEWININWKPSNIFRIYMYGCFEISTQQRKTVATVKVSALFQMPVGT